MSIRVVLADDQALIREGFRAILERDAEITVVGEASNGAEVVAESRRLRPDVVIMDIRMPVLDGIEATGRITTDAALSQTRVLVVTTYEQDANVFGALRAGASGFLLKDLEPDDLRRAIHIVAGGEALLAPSVTRRVIASYAADARARQGTDPSSPASAGSNRADARLTALTEREREITALVAGGLTNDEIAARLFISPTTVKTHISHAMLKVVARDRAQLVVFAFESGLTR